MEYKKLQRKLQLQKLLYKYPELFNRDHGGAKFDKYESLPFVLMDGKNNLYSEIQMEAIDYFDKNEIAWWGDYPTYPSGHLLSSQVQCINFLFALRKNKTAVLQLAQFIDKKIEDVLLVPGDNDPTYLAFEFIYENRTLLNETDSGAQRGAFCTSIDVFLIAVTKGKKILVPIEWKYTESYLNPENKAQEPGRGKTRQTRYNQLIRESKQLITPADINNSLYYFEPFYELMRQTLLVEQMVGKGFADDFLHILVAPVANKELLENSYTANYKQLNLEHTWKGFLHHPEKYKQVDSGEILKLLGQISGYSAPYNYLKLRYN